MKGNKINWTDEMVLKLQNEFSKRFSRDIGNDMGISIRSVIRKARELGLEKTPDFLEVNRMEITKRANDSSNNAIRKEKHRIKYGLPQKTKLNLKNIY